MRDESYEEQQEDLDPHRREERNDAALEYSGRLRQKGVLLTGRETSGELDDIMTAVERFEAAVVTRGGDLFVNTPFSDQPEDPDFVVPQRVASEDAETYAARINEAAARLEKVDL
jgi:23S rRNA G2069 N7-methylase RlmK/C1962 C5-methylase RlmI